ncbi:MAG: hypothetical protein PVF49_04710 [Anaerolineales bacterium]|jgi:hypothetical protein
MNNRRLIATLVVLMGLMLLTGACSSGAERPWLQPPDWSRGLQVGTSPLSTRVTFDLDDDGNVYFFYFSGEDNDDPDLQVTALGTDGQIAWDHTIPMSLRLPRQPRIINDGDALQLFWISNQTLFTMRIGLDGDILRQPQQISGQYVAFAMDVLLHPEEGLIVWFGGSRQQPGIYAYAPDDYYGRPVLIDELGTRPDLLLGSDGVLHAAWSHDPSGYEERGIYYARFPEMDYGASQGALVAPLVSGVSAVLDGPWLGQSGDAMLVLWNLSVMTGLEAGRMTTEYVVIPAEGVQEGFQQRPTILYVPSDYHEPSRQEATLLQTGERVWLDDVEDGYSAVIQELSIADFNGAELAIAMEAKVDFLRHKEEFQIAILFFEAGQPTSYQLITFNAASSRLPYLSDDDDGYLYLTWIQRAEEEGNLIFFGTTNPELRESISQFDGADAVNVGSDILFGLFSGMILTPIGIVWLLVPMVVIALTSMIRKEDEPFFALGTLISAVLAMASYWYGKYFTLQILDMTGYVPFSAWIPQIGNQQANLLRILVPSVIFVLSAIFAYRQTYGKENRSILFFMLFYSLVDSLLSLAVYGLLIYGAA